MTTPLYTPAEARTRETFLALMWAFSYPSRAYPLPDAGAPFALVGETLLDLETSFYTPDDALAAELTRNGARRLAPERAAYHVYPTLRDADMDAVRAASIGTLLFPDHAATLIIGCALGAGETYALRGPGIQSVNTLRVGGVPSALWDIRAAARFPLGWDVYLLDGRNVVGLPRSTQIERVEA